MQIINNIFDWAVCQKLSINGFNGKNTSKFNEEFIKNMVNIALKDIFLK